MLFFPIGDGQSSAMGTPIKILRSILILGVVLFAFYQKYISVPAGNGTSPSSQQVQPGSSASANPAVPEKAVHVLGIVRSTGLPPEGYVGGRVFENREGRLPAGGNYREFDVDPHDGGRNAERLIVEWDTKKAWYTGDHYETFTPVP